jgi:hypothetical protein
MQSDSWIALLERIPPDHYDNLMLVTNNGLEMAILNLLRIEEDYLVLRARMSGTDTGRILFMPYDRITYLGFQRNFKEADLRAMYGEDMPDPIPATDPAPEPVPQPTAPPAPGDAAAPPPPPTPAPPVPTPPPTRSRRLPLPDKNIMLERMRARAQAGLVKPRANP